MKRKNLRYLIVGLLSMVLVCSIGGCQTQQPDEPNTQQDEQVSGAIPETPNETPGTSETVVSEVPTVIPTPEIIYAPDEDIKTTGSNIGIHDPSIFYDPVSGNYYSYGSHMVAGTSKEMVAWTYICNSSVGTASTN